MKLAETFIDKAIYNRVKGVKENVNDFLLQEAIKFIGENKIDLNTIEYIVEEQEKRCCGDRLNIVLQASLKYE